jgi:glycosyltransferase involved in cell wall biosynthesis
MSEEQPLVSICTPTYNRRPFIESMFECFRHQTYPRDKMEWIIVDDGTDKIEDLIKQSNLPQIRYFKVKKKMKLGEKRNFMHKYVNGSIVVYMDDDDYYPPQRVEHCVETLLANPTALCAGSSELYVYFKHIDKMYQSGPFGDTHATAGTFAFKKILLEHTKYDDNAALAEERSFLKDYTIPFVQLDPMKTILVFSHHHNSFDKKNMLQNSDPKYFKESSKQVRDFIRQENEEPIYNFFMKEIDELLENYLPGTPENKPDVIQQLNEIRDKREKMMQQQSTNKSASIMIEVPGQGKRPLSPPEIVQMLTQQQNQIKFLVNKVKELESAALQKQMNDAMNGQNFSYST